MADDRKRLRLHNKLKELLRKVVDHPNTPLTYAEVCEYKRVSEETWIDLRTTQEAFYKKAKTDADYALEVTEEEAQEATHSELRMKLYPLIDTLSPSAATGGGSGAGSSSSAASIKLPMITLPNFDGKFSDWLSFKDLFNAAVATNSDLSNAQRLQYLKSSLRGEPANLVKSFATTDANYLEAWRILEERYDNKREIVHSLIGQIMDLKPVKNENARDIQNLLDGAVECLRSLKVQGCPVDQWDDLLVVIVVKKLDPDSRKEWAKNQTTSSLPKFSDLEAFLNSYIRGLIAAGSTTTNDRRPDQRLKAHYTGTGEQGCIDCGENHQVTECASFQGKSPAERSQIVKKGRACFNCMKRDHVIKGCPSSRTCKKCKGRHHTLLHSEDNQSGGNRTTPPRQQQPGQTPPPGHFQSNQGFTQPRSLMQLQSHPGCTLQQQQAAPMMQSQNQYHGHTEQQVPQFTQSRASQQLPRLQQQLQQPPSSETGNATRTYSVRADMKRVVLKVLATVYDSRGNPSTVRVFIDPGSEGDFITEACLTRLGLPRRFNRCQVSGFGEKSAGITRGEVTTVLYGESNHSLNVDLLVMPSLTGLLPSVKCQTQNWSHFAGITFSDPDWHQPSKVDILLGVGCFANVMMMDRRCGQDNEPFAWQTIFGWAVGGNCQADNHDSVSSCHIVVDPLAEQLKRFWEIEQPPKSRVLTGEEKKCEEHFKTNYKRDHNGRFVVAVPFKENVSQLGRSRDIAVRRQLQVERRLARNPLLREQYIAFMTEYRDLQHMKKVDVKEQVGDTNYLCHHFVTNESSSTTKLRVVFDGSQNTSSGVSLNDTMMIGAPVQDNLYDILLRWRTFAVVLKGDIKQMFRQFKLRESDARLHRIVWRDNAQAEMEDYQLCTVTYGTACAPYLATRCIQQLGMDTRESYPLASAALLNSTYVDDTMGGGASEQETIHLYHQLSAAVKTAGMEMRKWTSNSKMVMQAIPEELRDVNPLSFGDEQAVKALGVQWCPTEDTFSFNKVEFRTDDKLTKRILLSEIARVFDPLGLISCVVLSGKILLQELWEDKIDWDEPVQQTVLDKWLELRRDWKLIDRLRFPRRITLDNAVKIELHGFSDSSEIAYGAVCYLRSVKDDGSVHVSMVTSKTCVAPLQKVPLPRLELNAAVLLAELVTYVMETLRLNLSVYLWTDSTIALAWISASPRRWKTYVANRVSAIQELTRIEWWHHVAGRENPADLASRGASVAKILKEDLWTKGPVWLGSGELPVNLAPPQAIGDLEERQPAVRICFAEITECDLLKRFSSLQSLKRYTAIQFRRMMFRLGRKKPGPISALEQSVALQFWIKKVQSLHFPQEIASLERSGQVTKSSKLKSLYPFIDRHGILRVGGRLENAQLAAGIKHQVILPSKSHLVLLLVDHCHDRLFHGGFQVTWSTLQQEYWIIGGRDFVRHRLRKCVRCRRFKAKTAEQLMGNLPSPRVTPARCFLHTGVDYAGPFVFKNPIGRAPKIYKGYLCLFVCLVTKAIHLEAVSSLSTDAFIAALRRFVSIRGLCRHLYSDCGTNFVGADKELWRMVNGNVRQAAASEMSNRGIAWHFNPAMSPHRGGLWEAGVKSAKHHIRRVVGNSPMTYEQFSTLIAQVSAVLNSRPLYPRSADPDDLEPLTPGHFLIGEPLVAVPDEDVGDIKANRLSIYQQQSQRLQHFWKRWSSEYLNTLQQRVKWMKRKPSLRIGDMVYLAEETLPGTWKMGRVTATQEGRDGLVRSVTVKTANGSLDRAVNRVVPFLEMEEAEELTTSAKGGV